MARFVPGKMKRKGFDEAYEDFSDLSLSAPATKIRRLDGEMPPILEEWHSIGGSVLENQLLKDSMDDAVQDVATFTKDAVLPPTVNEERALVLYKPVHSHFGTSLKMDPELMSGLKNPAFWFGCQNLVEEDFVEEQQSSSSNCLAVIPWVSSQFSAPPGLEASASESGTIVGVKEVGADGESMEIDGDNGQFVGTSAGSGSFPQWQQHCMISQPSHLSSSPVLGSW